MNKETFKQIWNAGDILRYVDTSNRNALAHILGFNSDILAYQHDMLYETRQYGKTVYPCVATDFSLFYLDWDEPILEKDLKDNPSYLAEFIPMDIEVMDISEGGYVTFRANGSDPLYGYVNSNKHILFSSDYTDVVGTSLLTLKIILCGQYDSCQILVTDDAIPSKIITPLSNEIIKKYLGVGNSLDSYMARGLFKQAVKYFFGPIPTNRVYNMDEEGKLSYDQYEDFRKLCKEYEQDGGDLAELVCHYQEMCFKQLDERYWYISTITPSGELIVQSHAEFLSSIS